MIEYIPTTQAAAMLKAALRAAFPGVRFSVRKDRGTACAWLSVSYTDGPTSQTVQAIADGYTGRKFNGMTDGYDRQPDQLVHFDGEALPRAVRYLVDGVLVSRQMGPAGRAGVAAQVLRIAPDLDALDDHGNLTTAALTPEQAVELAGPTYAHGPATVKDVARQVFYALDMTAT